MKPWLDDGDVRLYHGSALDVLAALPEGSVQTCVTSPPYWGLRNYGTDEWVGGDPSCDHKQGRNGAGRADGIVDERSQRNRDGAAALTRSECRCGARRVDAQLGLEPTPTEYVESIVAVFREVWRVLRPDGTLWLNLGDSFLPNKQLAGIPWRVAFALQADGWYLRSDIIWAKPNPMPESVTDRPTKAHEYVFLLSKSARYFYDADAIREPHTQPERSGTPENRVMAKGTDGHKSTFGGWDYDQRIYNPAGRNARSVWDIATQPTPEAHFATYPEELVRRCVLAGSSEAGECSACGAPWRRQANVTYADVPGGSKRSKLVETTGWAASCGCGVPARPQTVLDPFVGSGTTALVARRHGRRAIGVDLNEEYLDLAYYKINGMKLRRNVSAERLAQVEERNARRLGMLP